MNKPTIGRIVIYNTTEADREFMKALGNQPKQLPAVIVGVWSPTCINVQVLNDGSGTTWKTSITEGTAAGQWQWPTRE